MTYETLRRAWMEASNDDRGRLLTEVNGVGNMNVLTRNTLRRLWWHQEPGKGKLHAISLVRAITHCSLRVARTLLNELGPERENEGLAIMDHASA